MTKKRVGANIVPKQRGGGVSAKEGCVDEPAADTVIQVINRRIRAAKKKLLKIGTIEEARAQGKEINDDQARTLESQIQVNAILEELVRIEPLVEKALKKEIEEAVAKALDEAGEKSIEVEEGEAELNGEEEQDEEETSLESASQTVKEDRMEEAGQLMEFLYISQVFGLGGTEADYEGFLPGVHSIEGKPVTRQQLEKLANLGKSLIMRSAHEGLTHQESLGRCWEMASTLLRMPHTTVDGTTTVSEMMELINLVKMSDFFQSMVVQPTPAPPIDPIPADMNAHVNPTGADPIPQVDPPVHHPDPTASGVLGHAPEPHGFNPIQVEAHESALECNPVVPAGTIPPQSHASGGGPRPFLPFPSLPQMPVAAPQSIPTSQTFQSHARVPSPMGFSSPMQGMSGYVHPGDYIESTQQAAVPHAPLRVEHAPAKISAQEDGNAESEVASSPLVTSLLHAQEARQAHLDDKTVPGIREQTINEAPVHKPKPNEMNDLDSRGSGRRPRGMDSTHGGSGPQGARGPHMGSQHYRGGQSGHGTNGNSSYNSGGRGNPGRGGGSWHGYRGHGEGRGRGRGRSSGQHYSGWDSGNSRGNRSQNANGMHSRGPGRGNRGGYKGGRGGGPWKQPSQYTQHAPQNAHN